ncbi:MAG TPA: YlbF family regulator [Candidatus Pullichristensenella avicola]|nr:YlbF family regulator [Candidatus Pullichristensenella avicola]
MDAVFAKTRELGQALIESEAYQNMKSAEERAYRNADAAEAMGRYLELRTQIQDMLSRENPDSAALKALSDEMDQTQEKMNMIDDVAAMIEARAAFSSLINQVNQVLQFIITGQVSDGEGGCSGSCSSCGGGCGQH